MTNGLDASTSCIFKEARQKASNIDMIVSESYTDESLMLRLFKIDRDEMTVYFSNSRVTLFSRESLDEKLVRVGTVYRRLLSVNSQ